MAAYTSTIPFFPAGLKLGIKSEELQKLFEDEEGGTVGFQNFPKITTTTVKGRGTGTLGYNIGGQPTRVETVFGETAAVPTLPTQPEEPETPEEPIAPEQKFLSSFIGDMGTPGVVGAVALGRAQEYGYDKPEILKMAEAEGLTFGEQAARGLELPYVKDLTKARGSSADPNYPKALGLEAVKRLQEKGYSKEAIQGLASDQEIKFGEKASSYLGGAPRVQAPSSSRSPAPKMSSFVGSGGTSGFMGQQAVQRAKASGLSESQIRNMAAQQGLKFGAKAFA